MAPKAPAGYSALSVHRKDHSGTASMYSRRLLLALSPLVLAVCFGGAAQAVGATSGPATHRRDGRNSFIGASPVDLDAAATTAAVTDVGATRSSCKTGTGPSGRNSARPSSALSCRGGAADQTKKGFLPLPRMRKVPAKENPPSLDKTVKTVQDKTVQDPWPERRSQVSEYLIGGGWIFLAALPAVLLGGRVKSGGVDGVDPNEVEALPPKAKETVSDAASTAASKVESAKRSTSKSVKKAEQGGSGVHPPQASLAQPLVDNANARAVGIIALAVVGSGAFNALATKNLLGAKWPITSLEPWQVLTAVAWAVNAGITLIGGRLDESSQTEPANSGPVGFFMPASWAFTIWAPIFFGELLFALYQLYPSPAIRGTWWLADVSPWFSAAMLLQSLWCASFRPWAKDAGLLWLPALLLGGVAVALGGAHGVLRDAWFAGDIKIPQYIVAHLPLSLHFGWISCAALVSLNGYFANVKSFSNKDKLALSICSVVVAVILGAAVTLVREDPVYAGVVAWALWAVGNETGWRNLKDRVDPGQIRAQELTAKTGSILALIAAVVPLGISLRDVSK